MVKKRLIVVIIFIVILSTLNIYLYLNKGGVSYSALSGNVISAQEISRQLDFSTAIFVLQWFVVVVIVVVAYVKHLKHKKEEKIKINYDQIKTKKNKSGTDLDILYEILKSKKKLKIGVIAITFNITKEKAHEWAKILENHELATIEYPAFNDPEVRINEKTQEKNIQ